jgi:hypothetical protein
MRRARYLRQEAHVRAKGDTMKLARTLALGAATLFAASGIALAGEGSSASQGIEEPSELSFEQSGDLVLLEPVTGYEALYGVDEDDDGVVDYLILEESDSLALSNEGEDAEVPEGG